MKMNTTAISKAGYKRLLETILDRTLTDKQVEAIKKGWRAFAEDPVKYADTIVVTMIQLDLNED